MEPMLWMALSFFCLAISSVHALSSNWSQQNGGCNKTKRRLIVMSMDGFRWDYLHGRGRTPTFEALKRKGVFAEKGMTSTFISNTLPNHFTLVTGLNAESHGMIDNIMQDDTIDTRSMYVPVFYHRDIYNDPRWYSGIEPIWVTNQLQRRDGRSGLLLWPGGEAPMKGVRPSRFIRHTYNMPEITQMTHLMKWLTDENDPINLGMVYFPEPDSLSHIHGPESDQVTRKIEDLDRAIQYLLDQLDSSGLASTTNILFLSDHGFLTISQDYVINLDDILEREWYNVMTIMPSSIASIFPNKGYHDRVYTKLKEAAEKTGCFRVYEAHSIPERFHLKNHRRVPPIFASANMNYSFITHDEKDRFSTFKGNHGYDNTHPLMRAIFMALGPSFKENVRFKTLRNVDVYPLMCHLLGLKPQPHNGSMEYTYPLLRNEETCAVF